MDTKPSLIPMETDVISSEEDDILARESPDSLNKSPPTPQDAEMKVCALDLCGEIVNGKVKISLVFQGGLLRKGRFAYVLGLVAFMWCVLWNSLFYMSVCFLFVFVNFIVIICLNFSVVSYVSSVSRYSKEPHLLLVVTGINLSFTLFSVCG